MSKFTGLSMGFALDDHSGTPVTLSDYVTDLTVNNSFGEQDVTPLSKFAMDRLQLVEDSTISVTIQGFPQDSIGDTLLAGDMRLPAAGRTVTITYPQGWTYVLEVMVFSRNVARAQNGGISITFELRLTGGTAGAWADGT